MAKNSRILEAEVTIQFQLNSHTYRLLTMLPIVSEYPVGALRLLGNERVYKAIVHRLTWEIARIVPDKPTFYLAKALKDVGIDEMNKTMFTRMFGAMFSGNAYYAVYNTRNAAMKWNGMGEFKAMHSLLEIGRRGFLV